MKVNTMGKVAIAPNVKGIAKLAVNDHAKWRVADELSTSTRWSPALTWLFWTRFFMILVMLILPVSLIAISPLTLIGYSALLAIPARRALAKDKVHSNFVDNKAYELVSQLKDGWKDHGDVFYKQIWEHTCNGDFRTDPYRYHYVEGREVRFKPPEYTDCKHCDRRLTELAALVESQKETEIKLKNPLDDQLFESSEQFRMAVAEQLEQPKLMRQISEGIKNA